jgi:GAF domain-containing protein
VVQIADITMEQGYIERFPPLVAVADLGGARTLLVVPMLKESTLVGAIGIFRQEVRPFTGKQIDLVKSFANRAVIAIDNTRLFEEVRARNRDLTALRRGWARGELDA